MEEKTRKFAHNFDFEFEQRILLLLKAVDRFEFISMIS